MQIKSVLSPMLDSQLLKNKDNKQDNISKTVKMYKTYLKNIKEVGPAVNPQQIG